tara:strand:- start:1370 stop:1570 length:201 start_codon:yes stop_codon:yes gene_type:complete
MNNTDFLKQDYEILSRKVEYQNELLHQLLEERTKKIIDRNRIIQKIKSTVSSVKRKVPTVSIKFDR